MALTPLSNFSFIAVKPTRFISCTGAAQSTLVANRGLGSHEQSTDQPLAQHFQPPLGCKEGIMMLGCAGRSAGPVQYKLFPQPWEQSHPKHIAKKKKAICGKRGVFSGVFPHVPKPFGLHLR